MTRKRKAWQALVIFQIVVAAGFLDPSLSWGCDGCAATHAGTKQMLGGPPPDTIPDVSFSGAEPTERPEVPAGRGFSERVEKDAEALGQAPFTSPVLTIGDSTYHRAQLTREDVKGHENIKLGYVGLDHDLLVENGVLAIRTPTGEPNSGKTTFRDVISNKEGKLGFLDSQHQFVPLDKGQMGKVKDIWSDNSTSKNELRQLVARQEPSSGSAPPSGTEVDERSDNSK